MYKLLITTRAYKTDAVSVCTVEVAFAEKLQADKAAERIEAANTSMSVTYYVVKLY